MLDLQGGLSNRNAAEGLIKGPPEIDISEIMMVTSEPIGEGTYGKVYKATCRKTSVAVKVPHHQELSEKELSNFRREVSLMSEIYNPNVVLFLGACTDPGNIQIVTEYCENGDLENFLIENNLTLYEKLKLGLGAAKGMSWLHGMQITHRDLKPANLLVSKSMEVKVTDFGLSERFKKKTPRKDENGFRGTILWSPPEILANEEFDEKIDVYAFGLILWQLYTCQEPYSQFEEIDEFRYAIINNHRPPIDDECPESFKKLIEDCWHQNRYKRPSFEEIVSRLQDIMVDVAIPDQDGSYFWKKYFFFNKKDGLKEEIEIKTFIKTVRKNTQVERKYLQPIQYYLEKLANLGKKESNNTKMTIHHFYQTIGWFGYYFFETAASETLRIVESMTSKDWFHDFDEKVKSEKDLTDKKNGTYLVRMSTTLPQFPYTLSFKTNDKLYHIRFKRVMVDADAFTPSSKFEIIVQNNTYSNPSLVDLLEEIKPILGLTDPCVKLDEENVENYLE